jgi:single-stranded DNA-binding protein
MEFSINKIDLLGGVADNPIEKVTRNGNPYISFNMFTNVEFRKPDGSFDENVELHNIIVFGGLMNYIRRNVQKGNYFILGFNGSV